MTTGKHKGAAKHNSGATPKKHMMSKITPLQQTVTRTSKRWSGKFNKLPQRTRMVVVALTVGVIGSYLVLASHAASNFVSVEPESGTITAPANVVSDATASAGKAIKFGAASSGGSNLGLHVVGNHLVDNSGTTIQLHGVDISSTEYACDGGWGISSVPLTQSDVTAMVSWHINVVRIPLNEDCWIDHGAALSTYNSAFTGANYQNAIVNFVNLLNQNGIYAILDLHWNGCGTNSCFSNWQKTMPDRPYATQFWTSVATTFKTNHNVVFDLFNEPQGFSDWACWENGGCIANAGDATNQFTQEGMQEMITAIRTAGATTQPVMLGGLWYSNDVSNWLAHRPTDPSNSMVLSIHLYNFNYPCPNIANGNTNNGTMAQLSTAAQNCYSSGPDSLATIAAQNPVVFGELGENDCNTGFVNPLMTWADQHGYSYLGWAWVSGVDCSSFPSLISNYTGTATAFGAGFKNHFTSTFAAPVGPLP